MINELTPGHVLLDVHARPRYVRNTRTNPFQQLKLP
jgi:hypothetical protein